VTIRTKAWLASALLVGLVCLALSLGVQATRTQAIKEEQTAADELARDIADDLKSMPPPANNRDLAIKLDSYYPGHTRIVSLKLLVDDPAGTPSRVITERGTPAVIEALPPSERWLGWTSAQRGAPEGKTIEIPVELRGRSKAVLTMQWTLGGLDKVLRAEERFSLWFGAGLLVVTTLVSWFLTDRIVGRPLEHLASAMRDVEGGDLDRRVDVASNDEVGKLSQGFNRMLQRLSEATEEIRAFNQRLAQEVEAATRDLSEKNAALGQLNALLDEMRREHAAKVRLATLGELAAHLAHEIGTPLSSISGHVQLAMMQKDLARPLRDRLEIVDREVARISKIVRDYLDSTRPIKPELRPTALARVLEEAVELSRGINAEDHTHVEVQVAPEVTEVKSDAALLRQIAINLVSNAFDAVNRKGSVTVAARRSPDGQVLITVGDNGPGIAPGDLQRIFEPFYTTKGRGKGTGLGLAIARQLTAALGGTISVESRRGAGATFFVKLPQDGGERAAEPAPQLKAV
jgi:signal transduction histidine kinase